MKYTVVAQQILVVGWHFHFEWLYSVRIEELIFGELLAELLAELLGQLSILTGIHHHEVHQGGERVVQVVQQILISPLVAFHRFGLAHQNQIYKHNHISQPGGHLKALHFS